MIIVRIYAKVTKEKGLVNKKIRQTRGLTDFLKITHYDSSNN